MALLCAWAASNATRRFAGAVRARAREAGLGERISFPGPRTGGALQRSYAAADLVVLPSRAETYGMVITEALARGLPVIASEVGGTPEALGHGAPGVRPGILVAPDDAQRSPRRSGHG